MAITVNPSIWWFNMVYPGENLQDLYFSARPCFAVLKMGVGETRGKLDIIWLVVWTPLKNMKVNWDDYSQIYGKNKHVPNNQPVLVLVYLPATSIDYLHQGNSITKRKTDPISRDVATTSWIARLSPYHQSHDLDGHLFFLPSVESFDVQNQKDMLGCSAWYFGIC